MKKGFSSLEQRLHPRPCPTSRSASGGKQGGTKMQNVCKYPNPKSPGLRAPGPGPRPRAPFGFKCSELGLLALDVSGRLTAGPEPDARRGCWPFSSQRQLPNRLENTLIQRWGLQRHVGPPAADRGGALTRTRPLVYRSSHWEGGAFRELQFRDILYQDLNLETLGLCVKPLVHGSVQQLMSYKKKYEKCMSVKFWKIISINGLIICAILWVGQCNVCVCVCLFKYHTHTPYTHTHTHTHTHRYRGGRPPEGM